MRSACGYFALAVAAFLALPLQEWLPPVPLLHGARVLLIPPLFVYGALASPFPGMLALAVYCGFLSDVWNLHVVAGRVEIAIGWSIVFYVILGGILSVVRPAFAGGRRWLAIPVAMVGTSLYLTLQFAMITLRRGGFTAGGDALWLILGSGLLAGGVLLLIHLATLWGARFLFHSETPLFRHTALPEP